MQRPNTNEYAPFFQKYLDLVGEGEFFDLLNKNTMQVVDFFKNIDVSKHDYRYAEGKWTIKDVFLHIIDTERGFSYRAIVCVRGDDKTPLHPMDEDFYAANADATNRSMDSLVMEFLAVRLSFVQIFETNTEAKFALFGNASGHKITARALGYISIGHALHHTNVIKERYLFPLG